MTPVDRSREIVYVLERFPGDTLNFVYNEIRGLERMGIHVRIYSLLPGVVCPEEALDFRDRTRNVRPVGPGGLARAWCYYLLRRPLALLGLLLTLPFDNSDPFLAKFVKTKVHLLYAVYFAWLLRDYRGHVHAHFAFKAALGALVAARLNDSSFSFTAHGSATVYPPSRYCLRSKIRAADLIVAVSRYNQRTMLELCPDVDAAKILVNRTGVILPQFPYAPRPAEREGPLRIVCVATLYAIKNHRTLLLACGELARRGIDFRLELIGKDDAGLGAGLRRLAAAEGITDRVIFHGGIDHGEVARHLGQADVCILTSFSEGVPVSLMEAMARGVVAVGPRVTGVMELISEGETGMLADPHDPGEFAAVLEQLARSPEIRSKLIAAARERVEAEYDMTRNSEALAARFARFLEDRGAPVE